MKIKNILILAILAECTGPVLLSQNAPLSIADTLVEVTGGVSVFRFDEIVLFRADGTFQVISNKSTANASIGIQTTTPSSGTYTYTTTLVGSELVGSITTTATSGPDIGSFGIGGADPAPDDGYPTVTTAYVPNAITGAANVSNNSWVTPSHPAISGFVIEGTNPRWVLVRGDGPSLSQFGVPDPVSNPTITLTSVSEGSTPVAVNPWSSDPNLVPGFQALFSLAGAFQFPSGSADCATFVLLSPGAYLVTASTSGSGGQVLTEVYVLPYGDQMVQYIY
jgi:hypothetical protein